MGFLDKARAAANDLAAKADTAIAASGLGGPAAEADRYFHDLGVLAYLDANGRAVSDDERARVMEALRAMEARGEIRSFALHTTAAGVGTVPPPPGAAPPPGAQPPAAATPPPADVPPPAPAPLTEEHGEPVAPTAPPPPPPSWARKEE